MPGVGGSGVPSLSQIVHWDIEHLDRAALDWENTGAQWEDHFTTVHRGTMSPGGSVWEGEAADAAQDRSFADLVKVRGAVDALREAASAARRGANELRFAQSNALNAIAEAEDVGLEVGEDLSVSSSRASSDLFEQAQQRALVRTHAAEIANRAIELASADKEVAADIATATAPLGDLQFAEAPPDDPRAHGASGVQVVDYRTLKEAPPIPDPGVPDDPVGKGGGPNATDIRGVTDKLPEGNKPWIREVRTPQDLQNLWKWMRQNGAEVPNGYGDPTKGTVVTLPDGTRVGQRFAAGSNGQPVLDIKLPGGDGDLKVHINPRGGIPEIPAAAPRPPAVDAPPRLPAPVEPPPARGGPPIGMGGGVMPDNMLPRVIHLPEAGDPDLPVIGDGIPDRADG